MRSRNAGTTDAATRVPARAATLSCDLCGEPMADHEFSQAVRDTSGLDICTLCLEAMIDAPALNARAEMGLVGGRH